MEGPEEMIRGGLRDGAIAMADACLDCLAEMKGLSPNIQGIAKGGVIGFGVGLYNVARADDKYREAIGYMANAAAFMFLGGLFLAACPVATTGAAVLAFGYFAVSCISNYVGDCAKSIYDFFVSKFSSKGEKIGAGVDGSCNPGGSGGPGGVEFRNIKPINGIQTSEFYLSKQTNIFFETEFEADLRSVFNILCLPKFRDRKINEYFDTILREASNGLLAIGELPFISLNFNDNHLLYSVMPSFYKNTLIGNIITFMDYFLKGFVNGGFFTVDFVRKWVNIPPNKRLTDVKLLNSNLIDIRKSLKKVPKRSISYKTLYDLVDTKTTKEFLSAFRIIGQMKLIESSEGILFPKASFYVEHDMNPSPHMQMLIDMKSPEAKAYDDASIAYFKMKEIVKKLMPKVPEFRGFFTALNMVTFALHYASSLHSIGKTVESKNAFQVKGKEADYVPIIPELFPPLPVSERIKIDPNIKTIEIIECILGPSLDKEIKNIICDDDKEDFETDVIKEFWNKIEKLYRKKVSALLGEDSKNYDDEDIHVHEFLSTSIYLLKTIPVSIKKELSKLLSTMEETYSNLTKINDKDKKKDKLSISQRYEKTSFSKVEAKCKKVLKDIKDFLQKGRDKALQKINQQEKDCQEKEKELLDIPVNQRKQPEFANYLAEVRRVLNEIRKDKNKINQNVNINNDIIDGFQKTLDRFVTAVRSFGKVYKEIIPPDHTFTQKFYLPRPRIVVNQDGGTINGGCLINFYNQPVIRKITKSEKQLSEIRSCLNSKNQEFVECSNGEKGFALKLNVIPLFDDGIILCTSFLKDLVRKDNKIVNNFTLAHTAASLGVVNVLEKMKDSQLNEETSDHKTPAYCACDNGNVLSIKTLINRNADFGKALPNGIYPFLVAIMNGHHNAVMYLLLNKKANIGDINRTTETGVTPLHWAIYYNFPDVVKLLLERGASVTSTLRSNGMTPIHMACYYDRYECLVLLAASKDAKYEKSEAGITPLQYAIAHSPSCARFLIDKVKCDINVKDPRGYNMRDIALMSGQYEIVEKLSKSGKMDHLIKSTDYLSKKESNEFKTLCRALSSGSLNIVEKLLDNMLKKSKLTLSRSQKILLIENACAGRRPEFVELLSKIINYEVYPIALYAAKEGLEDWIPEIKKFSGNLLCDVDGRTIFDEAVENSDSNFLKKAFEAIENVPEEIIKRVVKKSIMIDDVYTINEISLSLMPDKRNYYLLKPSDILFEETSLKAFIIYQRNLDSKVGFHLADFIDIISIRLVSHMLSVYSFEREDLKASVNKALKKRRSDSAFQIIEKDPSLIDEIVKENPSSAVKKLTNDNLQKAINMITDLIKDPKMNESEKVSKCKSIFKNVFEIGEIQIYGSDTLAIAAGISVGNLWILKTLPQRCIKHFYLSDEAFVEGRIDSLFRKEIDYLERLVDSSDVGSTVIRSLKKLNYKNIFNKGLSDEFVCALIDAMEADYIDAVDDEDLNTIFHVISRFKSLKDETMKRIAKSIKNAETPKMKSIINARNRNGENIILLFASSGNFKVLKYLVKLGIDIKNRDILGENVLHKILDVELITNDKVIPSISRIIHNNPELIIQQNRKGQNAFVVAAKKGFNGVIGLMSTYYPTNILDSSAEESALHFAAESNFPETVRYLIQNLHIDANIKTKDGLTPLHYAARSSSISTFKELLELGANPLIPENSLKLTAIDFALRYGTEEMINYITEIASFNLAICSPEILVNLVQNSEGYSAFSKVSTAIDRTAILTCDHKGNNLIGVACQNNNRNVLADLLLMGCDPEKTSFDEQNPIHICAKYSSIGCSILILKHICDIKGMEGVRNILKLRDSNGDLPYHIAARRSTEGFMVHLLTANYDYDPSVVNNAGYTALEESLKYGKRKIAAILTLHWIDSLGEKPKSLRKKLKDELTQPFDELLSSEEYQSAKKVLDDIKENAWSYSKSKYAKGRKPIEKKSQSNDFIKALTEANVKTNKKVIFSCARILNNMNFQFKILTLAKENVRIANKIINTLVDMQSSTIKEIAFVILFPKIYDERDVLKFLILINRLDKLRIPESHPLFAWIENGLISVAETSLNSEMLLNRVRSVVDLICFISENEDLMNTIEYPVLPAPVHVIASNILNIDEKYKEVQLKFASLISNSMLWKKNPTLSVDFCNRVGSKQYTLYNYVLKSKLGVDVLERVIQVTLDLYEDPTLSDRMRETILSTCHLIISDGEKAKNGKPDVSRSDIGAWSINSMKIIQVYGFDYYDKVIQIIPQSTLEIANKALAALLTINDPEIANDKLIRKGLKKLLQKAKEIEDSKFVESRDLDSILQAFSEGSGDFVPYKFAFDGTPVVKLSKTELEYLRKFGKIVEKQAPFVSINDSALEFGKEFKSNPTIENAAKLVSLVRQVIRETFGLNPFIVQCLTVGSILLHRVNKKERPDLKGRIAQVATGEGKSIIIAMLSSCIALTGDTVDVISSSSYLAERDAIKFKPFYEKLGLRCGSIKDSGGNYEEGFDFHVIYSTNTGFEFALLREGVNGKTMIETTLLFENAKRKRPRMTAIVDEADNLFIDTAMNSARIAQGGSSKLTWIFKPIFEEVSNKNEKPESIREKLLESATPDQAESLESVTNEKLAKLVQCAKKAMTLKNGVDYVVGRNKRTDVLEIQIVDAVNTGRIMHGSRWSNGLHEFVEVKEGLQVREQSFTVASISHPSFFELYQEVIGLTGTLGEESEREEIKNIYHVDTFDVPPNRKCLRTREKTIIVATKEKKDELILENIRNITKKRRPILVIVQSIDDSQNLSDLLRMQKIRHFVLNDQQPQDEDFIVDRAGRPGAVTIATNTAGRGTDIHVDQSALSKGGLHTLITFWPTNIRVECQALGRSGRQGQPGSCQIIFESDVNGSDEDLDTSDETLKKVYEQRTNKIKALSDDRIKRFNEEKEIFEILKSYFTYIKKIMKFLDSAEAETIMKNNYGGINSRIIKNDLQQKWAEFFSDVCAKDVSNPSFKMFLERWSFDKNYPLLSKAFDKSNK